VLLGNLAALGLLYGLALAGAIFAGGVAPLRLLQVPPLPWF
jgi:hypothetical protein